MMLLLITISTLPSCFSKHQDRPPKGSKHCAQAGAKCGVDAEADGTNSACCSGLGCYPYTNMVNVGAQHGAVKGQGGMPAYVVSTAWMCNPTIETVG